MVESVLAGTPFGHRFDVIVCGDDADPKPAPGLYLLACAQLGIEPARALALEDSPTGVRAAKAAGLTCLGVPSDPRHPLPEADAVVASLTELLWAPPMGLMRIVVNAVALLVAGLLVPGITIAWGDQAEGIVVTLVVLALVFGIVNASIGRLARLLSIPLNVLTLGLFSVIVNAALLLLVAWLVGLVGDGRSSSSVASRPT